MNTEKKTKINIRCSAKLHADVQNSAKEANMSTNTYICSVLAHAQDEYLHGNDPVKLLRCVQGLRSDMTADGRFIQEALNTLQNTIKMDVSADKDAKNIEILLLESLSQGFQKRSEIRDRCLIHVVNFIQGETQIPQKRS